MTVLRKKKIPIHVLVMDRDRELAAMLCDILSKSGVCISQQVGTIAEAQKTVDGCERVDVCILEVYYDGVNEAAIGFIKSNARKVSCVVFTQSESAGLGARCCEAGAKKVVDKKNFDKEDFIRMVEYVASLHLINPGYTSHGTDTYDSATGILVEKCPETVTAWA